MFFWGFKIYLHLLFLCMFAIDYTRLELMPFNFLKVLVAKADLHNGFPLLTMPFWGYLKRLNKGFEKEERNFILPWTSPTSVRISKCSRVDSCTTPGRWFLLRSFVFQVLATAILWDAWQLLTSLSFLFPRARHGLETPGTSSSKPKSDGCCSGVFKLKKILLKRRIHIISASAWCQGWGSKLWNDEERT